MSRSKLTLPFSQACKLTESQKCKLIECQGHRVALEEWEIKALLDVCCFNGWVDKGLAVLYEYAGHLDGFKKVVEERSICMEDVIDFVLGLSHQHGMLNIAELQSAAHSAASLLVNTVHTLSLWRRLQSCPRPLYVEERQGGRWSFPFLLRDEAKRFSDALFQSVAHVNLLDLLGIETMALIAAPYMDFDSFVELVKYQQKYANTRQRSHKRSAASGAAVDDDAAMLLRPDSPVRLAFEAVREVLEMEDRIERTWETLRSLPMFGGRSPSSRNSDPSKLYPVLRLPYREFKAPTEDLAWFQSAVPRYLELDTVLTAFVKTYLQGPPDAAQAAYQGPSGALGPMKGTYAADSGVEGSGKSVCRVFVLPAYLTRYLRTAGEFGDVVASPTQNSTPFTRNTSSSAIPGASRPAPGAPPGGFVRGTRSSAPTCPWPLRRPEQRWPRPQARHDAVAVAPRRSRPHHRSY
jgi:hypothetical protein